MKSITFLLFSAIWLKLALSFSVHENFTGTPLFIHIYRATDGLILVGIAFGIIRYKDYFQAYRNFFIIFAVILGLSLGTSIKTDIGYLRQATMSLKIFLPLLFFLFLTESAKISPENIKFYSKITIGLVLACTILGFLFLSKETNRNGVWSPAYFSGLHTTSYVWACLSLMIIPMIKKPVHQAGMVAIALIFINFTWGIRTAQFFLILFSILYFVYPRLNYLLKASGLSFSIMILLIISVLIFTDPEQTMSLNTFSSGRLQMYLSKFEQLSTFNLLDHLLGKGAGSDLIFTKVWWWEKKGSHNDYLTMLIEQGAVYLLLFVYFVKLLFDTFKTCNFKCLFTCYLATSLMSNGIMARPLAGYVLMVSICLFNESDPKNV